MMADISDPGPDRCEVLMGIASLDGTTLKDRPCIWPNFLGGILKTRANGLGSHEVDREHQHVINSRANPTRNPVTD